LISLNCYSQILDTINLILNIDSLKIHELDQAIKLNTNNSELYYKRALAKERKPTTNHKLKMESIIEDLNKAIELNPNYGIYFVKRATKNFSLSKKNHAIEDMNVALKLCPNNPSFYNLRGQYHKRLKNYKEAIEDYGKAIELIPNQCSNYRFRGDIYFELKEYIKAKDDYSKGLYLANKDSSFNDKFRKKVWVNNVYRMRLICKYYTKDFYGCIEDCRFILNHNEESYLFSTFKEVATLYLGMAQIQLGHIDDGCLNMLKVGEAMNREGYKLMEKNCK